MKDNELYIEINIMNILDSVSSVEIADKLTQEVYKKILQQNDTNSKEYKKLVVAYYSLQRLYKKLLNQKIEHESSFKIISVN